MIVTANVLIFTTGNLKGLGECRVSACV